MGLGQRGKDNKGRSSSGEPTTGTLCTSPAGTGLHGHPAAGAGERMGREDEGGGDQPQRWASGERFLPPGNA